MFLPFFTYNINKIVRNKPYWPADEIYLKALIFVHTVSLPQTQNLKMYFSETRKQAKKRRACVWRAEIKVAHNCTLSSWHFCREGEVYHEEVHHNALHDVRAAEKGG